MEINIANLPFSLTRSELTQKLAEDILHKDDFLPLPSPEARRINFDVKLQPNRAGGAGSNGQGVLTVPKRVGARFLRWVQGEPLEIEGRLIRFYRSDRSPTKYFASNLERTPYLDPKLEEKHSKIVRDLEYGLPVNSVEFGLFVRPSVKGKGRPSIEFSVECSVRKQASLFFDYDRKVIKIAMSDSSAGSSKEHVLIRFADVLRVYVNCSPDYLIFDTAIPASFEHEDIYRATIGDDRVDNRKYKQKIATLNASHESIAMYCYSVGITLHRDGPHDVVEQFCKLSRLAGLPNERIVEEKIEVLGYRLFSDKPRLGIPLRKLRHGFQSFDWPTVFQLESLLFHGILHTSEIDEISNRVLKLYKEQPKDSVAALLRTFNSHIPYLTPGETAVGCFEELTSAAPSSLLNLPLGQFNCYHVTFTPTRMITEGPYPTQSHRIIRRYKGFEDHFIRVDFCEEDRTKYGDDREVDSIPFLKGRVGNILKRGFPLGGRHFQFLAYSGSGLRSHSVWFMSEFHHPLEGLVNAAKIRDSIGDFRDLRIEEYPEQERRFYQADQDLLRHPSKYGARLGLAFTATRPSVRIRRDQWDIVPDIEGDKSRLFTDGIGTISEELGDEIWEMLHEDSAGFDSSSVKPSAYMIRFLGFKGVVAIDKHLGKGQGNIRMRLRPSMRKFGKVTDEAEIEIAQSFERPNRAYLNKPLIMILEDKGVKEKVFMNLLNDAVADVYRSDDTLERSYSFMKAHSLGLNYRLAWILEQLERLGCCIGSQPDHRVNIDYTFLKDLRKAAQSSVLREIKNDARIPIPDSYLLVGVADEGPAYRDREDLASESIYELREGEIYACIQETGDSEIRYLEGTCAICRSPLTHPGDVQRVQAIGKPPAGKRCFFAHMKNVVVFPCKGKRPLPSCLSGGDLDGDMYIVIQFPELLPPKHDSPASYEAPKAQLLSRKCNIEDVCDFVVTYIHSNVLGLLSTRLLTIADQSTYGIYDRDCLKLADLCSQAVDYSKHGVAIDLESNPLPRKLMRCRPDWQASTDPSPRETDYYESTRALGRMYQKCLKDLPHYRPPENNNAHSQPDALSSILKDKIRPYLDPGSCIDRNSDTILGIFRKYRGELRYICNTHILSETPGHPSALQESEVVMGTILTRYTDKNWRKDRTWRMKHHTGMLVRDVKVSLKALNAEGVDPRETLELVWCAWDFSSRRASEFGANSFGIVALGCLLHSLEKLSQLADV